LEDRRVPRHERRERPGARGDEAYVVLGERADDAVALVVLDARVRVGASHRPAVLPDLVAHQAREVGGAAECEREDARPEVDRRRQGAAPGAPHQPLARVDEPVMRLQ